VSDWLLWTIVGIGVLAVVICTIVVIAMIRATQDYD
jgi:hypothetical protein